MRRAAVEGGKGRALLLAAGLAIFAADVAVPAQAVNVAQADRRLAPVPAPRSWSSDSMVLPRVPYDNRANPLRGYPPDRRWRRTPESQRVAPRPPAAGGDPARFFDPPAANALSCESLRRLAVRTKRLYWVRRYERCLGIN